MTDVHKNYNVVHYCVGMSLDGPIYASHFVNTAKPKPNYKYGKRIPVMNWSATRVFQHEHNN